MQYSKHCAKTLQHPKKIKLKPLKNVRLKTADQDS